MLSRVNSDLSGKSSFLLGIIWLSTACWRRVYSGVFFLIHVYNIFVLDPIDEIVDPLNSDCNTVTPLNAAWVIERWEIIMVNNQKRVYLMNDLIFITLCVV
jgi:hypothetical protein